MLALCYAEYPPRVETWQFSTVLLSENPCVIPLNRFKVLKLSWKQHDVRPWSLAAAW